MAEECRPLASGLDARPAAAGSWRWSPLWIGLSVAVVCLLSLPGPAWPADRGYQLGPQDKVRVKVYEWRPSRDEIFEWSALNHEFSVGPAGTLSLPFVGEIAAAGMTTGELGERIAATLQASMGLGRRPDTSVEMVEYRPFYITGYVDRPGAFPYRPGLTVLQALSIAGGLRRATEYGLLRVGRDAIAARGDLEVFRYNVRGLLARRARLEAELKAAETIALPAELARGPKDANALILRQEQQIFDARREAINTQLSALEQLKGFFGSEVNQLKAQLETEDRQIRLVKKELQSVSALVAKGLAAAPRELALERTLAQIEGERLRVGTSLLRAQQEIGKTDVAIIELKNKRVNEAAVELRDTQAKLQELVRKAGTSEQLLYEAEVLVPELVSNSINADGVKPRYSIIRQRSGETINLDASEGTAVEPGDTIKVEMPRRMERYGIEGTLGAGTSRQPQARVEPPGSGLN